MKVVPVSGMGLAVVEPRRFSDDRGWFMESYSQRKFDAALREAGLPPAGAFVQDNQSLSKAGVVRGLHYQMPPHAQGKLVSVAYGRVWDVAVDVRRGSPTLGRWFGMELDAASPAQLWIPPGFAHGFVTLSETAIFTYKTTAFYDAASERAVAWNDPDLGIAWPLPPGCAAMLAPKDAAAPGLRGADLFP